jgi:flagellar motor component MotA
MKIDNDYEDLLKEGDRKMTKKLEEIQILEARVKFLKDNLRGAVKMYKEEKDRRRFAEEELAKVKENLKDPVNEARKAGL